MEAGLFCLPHPLSPSPPCGEGGRKGREVTQAELTTTPRFTQARGFTLWLTGLSGAGKSTLASAVADELRRAGVRVGTLGGDAARRHLAKRARFPRDVREPHLPGRG